MPQSLVRNYIHLVFSTRHRQPLIDTDIEDELHRYISGICEGMECQPLQTGGASDHIHTLFLLNKKLPLVKVVEQVKSHYSSWIITKGEAYESFYWQGGYAAFSVNPYETDQVVEHIINQREHHTKVSFQDELRAFLKKYRIEFDERYLWD